MFLYIPFIMLFEFGIDRNTRILVVTKWVLFWKLMENSHVLIIIRWYLQFHVLLLTLIGVVIFVCTGRSLEVKAYINEGDSYVLPITWLVGVMTKMPLREKKARASEKGIMGNLPMLTHFMQITPHTFSFTHRPLMILLYFRFIIFPLFTQGCHKFTLISF